MEARSGSVLHETMPPLLDAIFLFVINCWHDNRRLKMAGKLSSAWQYPFVNLFKSFDLQKVGDVKVIMDRQVKASVFNISGSIVASNYISLPKPPHHSLQLKGRFIYFLIKPKPSKYFTVHLEAATEEGLVIRVSFSNLYKEFKSTATWLRVPFHCKKDSANWSILVLDLQVTLAKFISRTYTFVKNVKVCGNVFIKNIFTSNIQYVPSVSASDSDYLLPPEISFHVPKGSKFTDLYTFIQFPPPSEVDLISVSRSVVKLQSEDQFPSSRAASTVKLPSSGATSTVKLPSSGATSTVKLPSSGATSTVKLPSSGATSTVKLPSSGATSTVKLPSTGATSTIKQSSKGVTSAQSTSSSLLGEVRHRNAGQEEVIALYPTSLEPTLPEVVTVHSPTKRKKGSEDKENVSGQVSGSTHTRRGPPRVIITRHNEDVTLDEPVLRLSRVVGCSSLGTCSVVFSANGKEVVYPSHAIVVSMDIKTRHQRFFMGHASKVSGITVSGHLLASGESGIPPVIRIWDFEKEKCLALIKAHHSDLHWLQFSENGSLLVGIGKDNHGRCTAIVWNTSAVAGSGDVRVVAKAHTDAAIARMKFAPFDQTRMVSCGWDNIRLWRLKDGGLKSCPVDLGSHHQLNFTDVTFQAGACGETTCREKCILASTSSGLVFEVHYQSVSIRRIWRLPQEEPASGVNALRTHEMFCVTGGDDGALRVWPLDFSSVLLEAQHNSPVTSLMVSRDGLSIVVSTKAGSVGVLDASTKVYTTLVHSHTAPITRGALTSRENQVVTVSKDKSVRVWDVHTGSQTHEFHAVDDCPLAVTCHPTLEAVTCGYSSGGVRVFSLLSASLLADHKCLEGRVTHCVYSKTTATLFVSTSMGALGLFDGREEDHSLITVHYDLLSPEASLRPFSVCDEQRRVAVIGPLPTIITVFDMDDMQEVLRVDATNMEHCSGPPEAFLAVSFQPPSYTTILLQTSTNTLVFFDLVSGRMTKEIAGWEQSPCTSASLFTDSGKHFLSTSGKMVKVWETTSSRPVRPQVFLGHCCAVNDVIFAEQSSVLVSLAESMLLWSFHDNKKNESSLAVSPRQHAPSPMEYTKPVSSMAAPTPVHPSRDDGTHITHHHTVPGGERDGGDTTRSDRSDSGSDDGASDSDSRDCDSSVHNSDESPKDVVSSGSEDGFSLQQLQPSVPPPLNVEGTGSTTSGGEEAQVCQNLAVSSASLKDSDHFLQLKHMIGIDPSLRHNLVWHPLLGFIVYSCCNVVILEDLSSSKQFFLTGHRSKVTALALQHSGEMLASSGGTSSVDSSNGVIEGEMDGEIRLWSPKSYQCVHVLKLRGGVASLDYSRDDRFLVAVGTCVSVWSCVDYRLVASSKVEVERVHQAKWNPYLANTLSTVGCGPHVSFWKLTEDTQKTHSLSVVYGEVPNDLRMHNQKPVLFTSLSFDSSSKLYVATSTGDVVVWNWSTGKCLYHWKCSSVEISVILSRHGRIITGGCDGSLSVWTAEHNTESFGMRAVSGGVVQVGGAITAGCFDDNLQMGVVARAPGSLYYVNWNDGSSVRLVTAPSSEVVAMVTAEGILATACIDGTVLLWSIPSLELQQMYHTPNMKCWSVCLHGRKHMVAGYDNGCVRVFDIERNKQSSKMAPHASPVTAVEISTDGDLVLSGAVSGYVAINDRKTGICMFVVSDHIESAISMLQCTPHMMHLSSCGSQPVNVWMISSEDGRHSVWGSRWVENVHVLVDWITLPSTKRGVARFSPVDRDLILVSRGSCKNSGVYFYSLSQHKTIETCELHFNPVTSLALSPCGKQLTAGGPGTLETVHWETGTFNSSCTVSGTVNHLCYFSSDSLVSSTSSFLCLWNITL